jgi:hypothetical protein
MNVIVSFPRSGQNLVEKIIEFCCREHDIEYSYCEFYSCCTSLPCKKDKFFSKNHDFILDKNSNLIDDYRREIIIDNNTKFLTLYRKNIILQLESYYRYDLKVHNKEYNYDELLLFIENKKDYYNNFLNKWINNKNNNVLKVEYYELIENPEKISKEIFTHFFPDIEIKDNVFKNLKDLEIKVYNLSLEGNFYHKISPINKLDDEIYQKIKKDLEI